MNFLMNLPTFPDGKLSACSDAGIAPGVVLTIKELQRAAGLTILPAPHGGNRGGRKSMGSLERRGVSDRMKKYWASRRKSG